MKIGIIGAMDVEVETLLRGAGAKPSREQARMTFYEGKIGKHDVVIVRSGVGKVNAACCVQILLDAFRVGAVINTGVAGSLDNRIDVGDFVISTAAMYHDVDATVFGYAYGEVPQLGTTAFPADEALRRAAAAAVRKAAPEVEVFEGLVASGDAFVAGQEKKEAIRANTGALCTEMEGAAIAQVCWLNGVPFVIVRAISDKADESVTVSYDEFESKAAVRCAAMVKEILLGWNPAE